MATMCLKRLQDRDKFQQCDGLENGHKGPLMLADLSEKFLFDCIFLNVSYTEVYECGP